MDAVTFQQTRLTMSVVPCDGIPAGISVGPFDANLMALLDNPQLAAGLLQSIIRVKVAYPDLTDHEALPDMLGRYYFSKSELRFLPLFPFEPGIEYRASFDARELNLPGLEVVLTLKFSLPEQPRAQPAEVTAIFPSADLLPENLLRFYVRFSHPMQRGRAGAEILLLGPDGQTVDDALYRAPVELWDRSMQQLTILLDPGRLKRGVGPNRELGPPLKNGQTYTLAVGHGMTDILGNQLSKAVHKHFQVKEAARKPIAVEQWKFKLPLAESRQPLVITFPSCLDWALLQHAIVVESASGHRINGQVKLSHAETRWSFIPATPWTTRFIYIQVASELEDVCGNNVIAPFDRPLLANPSSSYERRPCQLVFELRRSVVDACVLV